MDAAVAKVKAIVAEPEIGEVYKGTVKSIVEFGAFVEILPGKEGLLHVSEIDWRRIENVSEVLNEGDEIDVKLLDIDKKTGKLKLSHKVLIPKPEGYVERPARPQGERPFGPRSNNNGGFNRGPRNDNRQGGNGGFRPRRNEY